MTETVSVDRRHPNVAAIVIGVVAVVVLVLVLLVSVVVIGVTKSQDDARAAKLTTQVQTYKQKASTAEKKAAKCEFDYAAQKSVTDRLRKVAAQAVSATTAEDYDNLSAQMDPINSDEENIDGKACTGIPS